MTPLTIHFERGGVWLPRLGLWLDPHEPKSGLVFISHAHADHVEAHREVILTEPTARLMAARMGGERVEHTLVYGETRTFNAGAAPFEITLLPAGHIFGSAMSLIRADGQSLLYTGDFKLRPGRSAEPCKPCAADVLIMETTFGRPHYRFPPTEDVLKGIVRFCREALDNDETPVLLGYSLGKSQELLCGLGEAGLPIMLHGSVHKLTRVYEHFGQCFPPYEAYQAATARGKVLVCPPHVAGSAMLRGLGPSRVAVLTGWAVDPNCRFRYRADAAFPLSDHADFHELIEFVRRVQPQQVFTLHGFAADFAQTLRGLGFLAQAISEEEQMGLGLDIEAAIKPGKLSARAVKEEAVFELSGRAHIPGVADAFLRFAETCANIGASPSKLEKVRLLAGYLKTVPGTSLATVTVWFTGLPFAACQNKVLQLGWALLRDALCEVGGISPDEFHQIYLKHSDVGETALEIWQRRGDVRPTLTLPELDEAFHRLHAARGPSGKRPLLVAVLRRCSALEAKYLVKIITSDLRVGLKEGLVEEAVAQAFGAAPEELRRANLLLGHIGETAVLAEQGRLASASLVPFRPVKFMLASPEPTSSAVWERMRGAARSRESHQSEFEATCAADGRPAVAMACPPDNLFVWVEDKYDGVRCQLHKVGARVALCSRDLKDITATFAEIAEGAASLSGEVILDGELLAMRGDRALPFAEIQRRLGRREPDLFLREEVPIRFVAFDLLWRDGNTWLDRPLRERWEGLRQLTLPPALRLAYVTEAKSVAEIDAAFEAARARNNEGLMIKDPESFYLPGRRGLGWIKLKKAFATLDCVVVGAEYGHGKRSKVLSDYTFAVRGDSTGELKTIGKAYTGLTDVEIAALTNHFLSRVVRQHGRYHEVVPDTVLEIAFDRIQLSQRHSSGLALRFPRILRVRTDKGPDEIDTVSTARRLLPKE